MPRTKPVKVLFPECNSSFGLLLFIDKGRIRLKEYDNKFPRYIDKQSQKRNYVVRPPKQYWSNDFSELIVF